MEEIKGVAPEGATPVEGATPQPETAPETVSASEYNRVLQELDHVKKSQSGSDKTVAKLKGELLQAQQERDTRQADVIGQQLDILAQAQSGTLDETKGSAAQQISQIRATAATQIQAVEAKARYEQHVNESTERIREIMTEGGIDPDSQVPEAIEVQKAWGEAVQAGKPLNTVIDKATKVVLSKMKTAVPDVNKLKEEIKREVLEEYKKSGSLKVETGSPSAGAGSRLDIINRFAEGDKSVTRKQYEEAIRQK